MGRQEEKENEEIPACSVANKHTLTWAVLLAPRMSVH